MGEDKVLTTFEQETLIGTIRARLERNEKGASVWIPDPTGPWKIITKPPTSGLIRYFIPAYQEGYDPFGQPIKRKNSMTPEEIMKEEYAKLIMNWEKAYVQQPSIFQAAHSAIILFADQEKKTEALSFTAWTHEVGWWHKGSDPNTGWYDPHNTLALPITLDELYERFKEDNNIDHDNPLQ